MRSRCLENQVVEGIAVEQNCCGTQDRVIYRYPGDLKGRSRLPSVLIVVLHNIDATAASDA